MANPTARENRENGEKKAKTEEEGGLRRMAPQLSAPLSYFLKPSLLTMAR